MRPEQERFGLESYHIGRISSRFTQPGSCRGPLALPTRRLRVCRGRLTKISERADHFQTGSRKGQAQSPCWRTLGHLGSFAESTGRAQVPAQDRGRRGSRSPGASRDRCSGRAGAVPRGRPEPSGHSRRAARAGCAREAARSCRPTRGRRTGASTAPPHW